MGFALEGSANRLEEDSFSGDGLEREKRWLEHFRERRGGARSTSRSGQKDSPASSRDSSRYSFSTEFSSGNVRVKLIVQNFRFNARFT